MKTQPSEFDSEGCVFGIHFYNDRLSSQVQHNQIVYVFVFARSYFFCSVMLHLRKKYLAKSGKVWYNEITQKSGGKNRSFVFRLRKPIVYSVGLSFFAMFRTS